MRWRVERAGTYTGGYGLGWVAMNTDGTGGWFRSWREAMEFAVGPLVSEVCS